MASTVETKALAALTKGGDGGNRKVATLIGNASSPDTTLNLSSNGYVRRTGANAYTADARGQLLATNVNDDANSGNVGQYVESVIDGGSAVSLTSTTPKNVTSISLTAGDWDVEGLIAFLPALGTTVTDVTAATSTTSATLPAGEHRTSMQWASFSPGGDIAIPICTTRLSLSSTTTVYLVARAGFGASTLSAYGKIRARRVR